MGERSGRRSVASRPGLAFASVCLGFAVASIDSMVVNVGLPAIRADLGGRLSLLQWVVNGYVVVFACLLLSAGALGDRIGQKRVYFAGLGLFGVASPLCSLAPSVGVLVGARVLQGAGAALMLPSSFALITHTFPDPAQRARAISIWMGTSGVASAAGPAVGGILVDAFGWRSIFWINVPIVVLSLALGWRHITESPRTPTGRVDVPGQVLAVVTLASFTLTLSKAADWGWLSAPIIAAFAACVALLAAFIAVERGSRHPMLPLDLFRLPNVTATTVLGALNLATIFGALFVLTLFLQEIRGYSPLRAGFALMPVSIIGAPMCLIAGRLNARHGPRRALALGFAIGAIGALVLATVGAHTSYWVIAVGLILAGGGTALAVPSLMTSMAGSVPPDRAGIGGGMLNAARQTGGAFGVALFATILAAHGITKGLHVSFAIITGIFVTACVVAARCVGPLRAPEASVSRDPAVVGPLHIQEADAG